MSSDRVSLPAHRPAHHFRRSMRALAGLIVTALIATACSETTPSPTATVAPTAAAPTEAAAVPTAEPTPESVLGPAAPTAIPLASPTAEVTAEVAQSQEVTATGTTTETAQAQAQTAPATTPITPTAALATAGTFAEDNALCEQFIGEDVSEGLAKYLRCGYFSVPEQHANPDGPQIKLPVVVLKSASPKPATDPLLMLQGGPGGSGIREFFDGIVRFGFTPGDDRDIILVDQRGSFLAQPALICSEYRETAIRHIQSGLMGEAAEAERLAANAACRQRLVSEGINLAAYNSVENAADIAALPRALGYTDYNIYGVSYGSLLAQHILSLHPRGVRSVILDGVIPRDGKFTLNRNASFQQALQKVAAACAANAICAKDYPDIENRFIKLVTDLNASPAPMTITTRSLTETVTLNAPLTGEALLTTMYTMLFDSYGISRLPRLVDLVEKRDLDYLSRLRDRFELQPLNQTTIGLFNSVFCSEQTSFTEDEAAAADAAVHEELKVFRSASEVLAACQTWNVPQLGDAARGAVASDVPVLVLNGEFDPVTPPSFGQQAASGLTGATQVRFNGKGHGQAPGNACAASLIANFLNAPGVPLDTKCAAEGGLVEFSTPTVELTDFTDVSVGIGSKRPIGWIQVAPGLYADDVSAAAIQFERQDNPNVAVLQRQLETGNFKRGETRQVGDVTWRLFTGTSSDGQLLQDIAIGRDGRYVVQLFSADASQREGLYEGVFLPALESFIAIQAPAQTIVIETPQLNDEVTSPAPVSGYASKTPFENNLVYRIYNSAGLIISEGPISVKGNLGSPGTFATTLPFTVTQREAGRIEVLDIDAATGVPFATAAVSVTLTPLDLEGQLPAFIITLDAPAPNAVIASPAQVKGSINVTPFENNLVYRVFDASAAVIGQGPITVIGELAQPGAFDATIVFTPTASGPGRVLIEAPNEAGGPPFATSAVDVQLQAPQAPAVAPQQTITPTEAVTTTEAVTPTAAMTPTEAISPTEVITPTAVITPTETVTTTAAMTPTEAVSPSGVITQIAPASIDPDRFSLNPAGLARRVTKELRPGIAFNPNEPPQLNGWPPHLRFRFDSDRLADDFFAPRERQLLIFPLAEYRAQFTGDDLAQFDEMIASLKNVLQTRPKAITETITLLPTIGASQVFRSQIGYLDFDGGSCVRFVTAYRQDVGPITDTDTFYTCQGLSSDGNYYVSFVHPIRSTATPTSIRQVSRAELARIEADPEGYLNRIESAINRLSSRSFRPFLSRLDAVVKSLTIEPR